MTRAGLDCIVNTLNGGSGGQSSGVHLIQSMPAFVCPRSVVWEVGQFSSAMKIVTEI